MILPVIVIGTIATTAWQVHKRRKRSELTPEKKRIFEAAMNSEATPEQFETLAKAFDADGLTYEAGMLRKRAALSSAPPEVKKARREAYRKALESTNKAGVLNLADAFAQQGAVGAAKSLRSYAAGLIPNMQGYVKPEDVDPSTGSKAAPESEEKPAEQAAE